MFVHKNDLDYISTNKYNFSDPNFKLLNKNIPTIKLPGCLPDGSFLIHGQFPGFSRAIVKFSRSIKKISKNLNDYKRFLNILKDCEGF